MRVIILTVCIPSLLLSSLVHYLPIAQISRGLAILIERIGLVLFLLIVTTNYTFDSLIQTYLPKDNRTKYRATDRFLSTLFQFSALIIFLYLAWKYMILISFLFFAFMLSIKSCSIITLCGPY